MNTIPNLTYDSLAHGQAVTVASLTQFLTAPHPDEWARLKTLVQGMTIVDLLPLDVFPPRVRGTVSCLTNFIHQFLAQVAIAASEMQGLESGAEELIYLQHRLANAINMATAGVTRLDQLLDTLGHGTYTPTDTAFFALARGMDTKMSEPAIQAIQQTVGYNDRGARLNAARLISLELTALGFQALEICPPRL